MEKVDPLDGLRGLCTVHIVLLHYFFHCENIRINLHGAVEVPIFYLLAGYCSTLGYGCEGRRTWSWWGYMRNRAARILPLYWVTNLIMYLVTYNFSFTKVGFFVVTMSCTNTWLAPGFPSPNLHLPFNHVSWTISTLFFFYLVFPLLLPYVQQLSDRQISRLIVLLHFIQCFPFLVAWTHMDYNFGSDLISMNPVLRLPVFLMGILGGVQTLRWREGEKRGYEDPNENQIFLHDILPWGVLTLKDKNPHTFTQGTSVQIWGRRADRNILVFLAFICCGTIYTSNLGPPFYTVGYAQLYLVHLQLIIILGISRGADQSVFSTLCSSRICQFLGKISMCLYLLHSILLKVALTNVIPNIPKLRYLHMRPVGLNYLETVVLSVLSVLLSSIVHEYFEEPVHKLLSVKKKSGETTTGNMLLESEL